MAPLEAQNLISARVSTVWDIITDSGNFAVWESGITAVTGELRNGGTMRVGTRHGGSRSVGLRVEQIPGGVMTWARVIVSPRLGVFKRTFVLTPKDAMKLLLVRDEISGLLRSFVRSPFGTEEDLIGFVTAVKERAEILG
jgi:hypothetical protein